MTKMKNLLKDKVAIVTGASSGIGEHIAMLLARHGAKMVLTDRNEDRGKRLARQIISEDGDACFYPSDISIPEDAQQLADRAKDHYGHLDIAVNNTAMGGEALSIEGQPPEACSETIADHLSGVFYGMKYQIAAMLPSGGAIINMASVLAPLHDASSDTYLLTRHGMAGITKAAAREYASMGIRVNAIGPGFIKTGLPDQERERDEKTCRQIQKLHSEGRLGEPDEVAEMVLWLASDQSALLNQEDCMWV